MTRAMTREHPDGHRAVPVRDQDGELSCLSCGHIWDWGNTGRRIGYRSVPGRTVNRIVAHVPEPIRELDDDEFANAGGLR